jgi:REP-associated tyrosine transposase
VLPGSHVEASQAPHPAVARVPHARWQASRRGSSAKAGSEARVTCEATGALALQPRAHDPRIEDDIRSLRRRDAYHAIRRATHAVLPRRDFRIVHISLQHSHIHLVVEADNERALACGMRAFEIACARRLNAAVSAERRNPRRGRVFADRYYARALRTPGEVRNVINYVLNNWRHHGEHVDIEAMSWHVDYFSSGPTWGGWAETPPPLPGKYEPLETSPPATWLLNTGWKKRGAISMYAVPGRDYEEA